MSGIMQRMAGMGMRERMRFAKDMAEGGMLDPNAELKKEKQRSKRGPVDRGFETALGERLATL